MGNHHVGISMASAAKVFWLVWKDETPPDRDTALEVLDAAAEHFHGADAEFDDELQKDTDLGRLISIAFEATPEELADPEDPGECDPWYDGPQQRFSDRYGFC